ncbi:MAG: GNAT family N-acetyltransferase [Chloroflexi bacterium]|nr:GNAT family N-acetyltransferase [Chloroflexota bacterium]
MTAAELITATLAAESCCDPAAFLTEGVHISELTADRASNPLVRRFPTPDDILTIASTGTGVVVAATPQFIAWATEIFHGMDADDAFSPDILGAAALHVNAYSLRLNGPYAYNVVSEQSWVDRSAPSGYALEIGGAELLQGLNPADWQNAIAPHRAEQGRHDAVAAVALHADEVVGVAAASADADALWQIGVDVHPSHRNRGIATALTSQAARAVLDAGKVPYYGTSINNIASRRAAHSAGFYPCWVSAFTTAK